MKRSVLNSVKALSAVILMLVMAACGAKTPDAAQVASKIDAKETLTQADYKAMLEYCAEYASKAQDYYNVINRAAADTTAAARQEGSDAMGNLANLYGQYNYLDMFRTTLESVPFASLDKENRKIALDNASLQGFPLMVGEDGKLLNPEVQGMIEQMPSVAATDSTGVLSNGDGEAAELQVK